MYERFSDSARAAASFAADLAVRRGDAVCHTGHLLVGIFATKARRENRLLDRLELDADVIESHLDADPSKQPRRSIWRIFRRVLLSDELALTVETSVESARDRSSSRITVNDVLIGTLAARPNYAVKLLGNLGVDETDLRASCTPA